MGLASFARGGQPQGSRRHNMQARGNVTRGPLSHSAEARSSKEDPPPNDIASANMTQPTSNADAMGVDAGQASGVSSPAQARADGTRPAFARDGYGPTASPSGANNPDWSMSSPSAALGVDANHASPMNNPPSARGVDGNRDWEGLPSGKATASSSTSTGPELGDGSASQDALGVNVNQASPVSNPTEARNPDL